MVRRTCVIVGCAHKGNVENEPTFSPQQRKGYLQPWSLYNEKKLDLRLWCVCADSVRVCDTLLGCGVVVGTREGHGWVHLSMGNTLMCMLRAIVALGRVLPKIAVSVGAGFGREMVGSVR